jgi:hypothetical protein
VLNIGGPPSIRLPWRPIASAQLAWPNGLHGCGTSRSSAKADQDRLDAVICLLIAIRWRLEGRDESIMTGDPEHGYVVAPISRQVRSRLERAAKIKTVAEMRLQAQPSSQRSYARALARKEFAFDYPKW